MIVTAGSTNVSVYFYIVQDASGTSPGEPVTGLLFSDIETGGSASYARQGAARVDLTLITLASASAAHSDGGFILVDDTNMPGVYRCDYADATFATGVDQVFLSLVVASAKNAVAAPILVDITDNVDQTGDTYALANGSAGFVAIDTVVDAIKVVTDKFAFTVANQVDSNVIVKTGFSLAATGLDAIVSTATGMVEIAKAVWDRVLTGATHNINNSAGRRLRQLSGSIFTDGTLQSATANTAVLASGDVTYDGQYVRSKIITTAGTGVGQEAIITDSVASTDTVTITPAWSVTPDVTTDYEVVPAQSHATVRNGGYDNGKVYVDIANGAAGTLKGVNGTTTNPSGNFADARTIADLENIRIFDLKGGGALTLDQAYTNWLFDVVNAALLDMNGKDVSGSVFMRTGVTGTALMTTRGVYELCGSDNLTTGLCNFLQCGFSGTTTLSSEDRYLAWDCFENSSTIPVIDIAGDGITATVLELVNYSGRVEIQNLTSTDTVIATGQSALTLNANCSGGTLTVSGDIKITDNSGGAVTIVEGHIGAIETAVIENAAGADISADIAALKAETVLILADTDELVTDDIPGLIAALNDPTSAAIATAVWDTVCETEGSYTAQQILSVVLAVCAGVTSNNGATLETPNGVANRVVATIDASQNRTAMTISPSA